MDTNSQESQKREELLPSKKKLGINKVLKLMEGVDSYFLQIHTTRSKVWKQSFIALLKASLLSAVLCSPSLLLLSKFNNTPGYLICFLLLFGLIGAFGAFAALVSRFILGKAEFPILVRNILSCWNATLLPSITFGMILCMVFLQLDVSPLVSIPLFCGFPGLLGGITALLAVPESTKEPNPTNGLIELSKNKTRS